MTLYDQIKDDLLSKIKDGTYPEGQTIPSELELAEMYGVSRPTIRQALQILVSDGYLEKRRRRGTVVTKPKVSQSFTMSISSFEDAMRLAGRLPKTKVLVFKRERANAEVEKRLELTRGQDVFKLVRLRYADDLPNVFVESYIPCTTPTGRPWSTPWPPTEGKATALSSTSAEFERGRGVHAPA